KVHGVSFDEAITVFGDPLLRLSTDTSDANEERFIAIGRSEKGRDLFVVHCYRDKVKNDEEIIRIISARKLEKYEKRRLEKL
ncbi:MAG: BrnT family toxin, partial [Alphaproteobacteria bacterium]|nr:BrnT family toxin [Alphaproteobacteria bacterium]